MIRSLSLRWCRSRKTCHQALLGENKTGRYRPWHAVGVQGALLLLPSVSNTSPQLTTFCSKWKSVPILTKKNTSTFKCPFPPSSYHPNSFFPFPLNFGAKFVQKNGLDSNSIFSTIPPLSPSRLPPIATFKMSLLLTETSLQKGFSSPGLSALHDIW